MERRRVLYSGRVQGVGFRYRAAMTARRYDVSGYVRNLPDGRVELVAEGPPGELDRFLEDVAEAMRGYIRGCRVQREEATGQFRGFAIRH